MQTFILSIFFSCSLFAAENVKTPAVSHAPPSETASGVANTTTLALDYPELQVVPRASERLQMAAQSENEQGWMAFWPLQLSALTTLSSGIMLSGRYRDDTSSGLRDDLDLRTKIAMGLGVSWIAISTYYMYTRPYIHEYEHVKNRKTTDRRSELLRERLAEEALERPAKIARIFVWTSFATNLAMNVALYDHSTSNNNIYPALGIIAAGLPLLFNNDYISNYEKHLEYKRKIYAPIAYVMPTFNTATVSWDPRMVFEWSF